MKNPLSYLRFAVPALVACSSVLLTPDTSHAGYWTNFTKHWTDYVRQQNGVMMMALVLGAICIFIITRGKWRK